MMALLKEIRHNPLLWLLAFVPVVFLAGEARPEARTLLFVLSVLAIVSLACLLSHAPVYRENRRSKIGGHQRVGEGVPGRVQRPLLVYRNVILVERGLRGLLKRR
jgi:hypothetical protein